MILHSGLFLTYRTACQRHTSSCCVVKCSHVKNRLGGGANVRRWDIHRVRRAAARLNPPSSNSVPLLLSQSCQTILPCSLACKRREKKKLRSRVYFSQPDPLTYASMESPPHTLTFSLLVGCAGCVSADSRLSTDRPDSSLNEGSIGLFKSSGAGRAYPREPRLTCVCAVDVTLGELCGTDRALRR